MSSATEAIVFLGPTMAVEEASTYLEATYLPPAAQGDVYRAARAKPRAIGIVDGYFERIASVWHKEILWALSRGIYVFGSASMGALRAVELAPFGMVGVGEVVAAFQRGDYEDDDEVAVRHGPPDTGYRKLSEAMVNIRATLGAAVRARVLTSQDAGKLSSIAKGLHYGERSYRTLRSVGERAGIDPGALRALEGWLPEGAVDRKRLDAVGMLRTMGFFLRTRSEPYQAKFDFEHTEQWEAARLDAASRSRDGTSTRGSPLLEEVKLSGELPSLRRATLARLLVCDRPESAGVQSDEEAVGREVTRFRLARGLEDEAQFRAWRGSEGLSASQELTRLFADESATSTAELRLEAEILTAIPDELKLRGSYGALLRRAREKQALLSKRYLEHATLAEIGLSEADLWSWYFERLLKRTIPSHIGVYASAHGFRCIDELRQAVVREYAFREVAWRRAPTKGAPSESAEPG